jgi:hypothetical protein
MKAAEVVDQLARHDVATRMTDKEFIVAEINRFRRSQRYLDMVAGENYYKGKHDIRFKQRTAIGENGKLTILDNLPNNKIVDNQYKKMVDQKVQYIVGQPFLIQPDGSAIKTTEMLALNIYSTFYSQGAASPGFAQAKAVVFFILVATLGLIQLYFTRKKEVQQ